MKSDSVIRAKFRRLNISTANTNLWQDVTENIKNEVDRQVQMVEGEIKIILVFLNPTYWWILTNQRLILNKKQVIHCFNLTDIKKVEPKKLFEGDVSKKECAELDLNINDRKTRLKVEENTWQGVYNILKFVIDM